MRLAWPEWMLCNATILQTAVVARLHTKSPGLLCIWSSHVQHIWPGTTGWLACVLCYWIWKCAFAAQQNGAACFACLRQVKLRRSAAEQNKKCNVAVPFVPHSRCTWHLNSMLSLIPQIDCLFACLLCQLVQLLFCLHQGWDSVACVHEINCIRLYIAFHMHMALVRLPPSCWKECLCPRS